MRWITREHVKVDRVACPWLIRRFVDPEAEFLFVPAERVLPEAERLGATPFDVAGVDLGHHDGRCSFEAMLERYRLAERDPALALLGRIVNGADTDNSLYGQPEGPGLQAIATGFGLLGLLDDHAILERQSIVYDALYAYCQSMVARGRPRGAFLEPGPAPAA